MEEVRVLVHFGVPVERAFDAVSNHETFLHNAVAATRVIRPGDLDYNGLGCMREVTVARRVRFVEEVTGWDRPARLDYIIRESSLPVRHEGGSVRFLPKTGGTDVEWTTRFSVPVPLVGTALGKAARGLFTHVFRDLLLAARAKLEGE
ncbi:MAG: SRPBCC family protein [Polyangiaceae bacterium]